MKHAMLVSCAFILLASASGPVLAGDSVSREHPPIELRGLLDQVAKADGRKFLLAAGVPTHVAAGYWDTSLVSYPILLSILRNNDLAAVTVQGTTNIVPINMVRAYPIPTVNKDDASIADDEWVTRIVQLKRLDAAHAVPILRPLMPQAGHLAAMASQNSVLIVDRYGNVRRLTELLGTLDERNTGAPPKRASAPAPAAKKRSADAAAPKTF